MVARYFAGLPFDVEVRSPPEVRAALRDLGRRLQTAIRSGAGGPDRGAMSRCPSHDGATICPRDD